MRDLIDHLAAGQATDPMEAARRAMRAPLRRRFYEAAAVADGEGAHVILLDGKPVRTPARNAFAAPTRPLAEALAAEWGAQAEFIDPSRMPLTRLANSIIDGVSASPRPVAEEVERYAASDLLFYRADGPPRLVERQTRHWDPIVAWARDEFGARFVLAEGVVHAQQPDHALAAIRNAIPRDRWRLGAVHATTTLTGSALIALALAHGKLSTDAAWQAAHLDEDWNMEQWGRDELALEHRQYRFGEMQAAATVLSLA
jgi:chaperone required for assembly of F1-ATPase